MQIGVGIGFWGSRAGLPISLLGPDFIAPGLTFARASSATYVDGAGVIQTVTTNVPRYPGGLGRLLIEGARTNLFLNSATLATQNVTAAATTYTMSFYGTGSVTLTGTASGTLAGTGAANRVSLSVVATAGTVTATVTGSVTNANFEVGTFASAWIPTTGTTATRARDSLSGLLSALGLPATGFTLSGRTLLPQAAPTGINQYLFQVDDGSNTNRIAFYNPAAGLTIRGVRAPTTTNGPVTGSFVAGTSFGWAAAVNLPAGTMSYAIEGGSVQTVTGGPTSGLTTLQIGQDATGIASPFGTIGIKARSYIVPDASLLALATAA